MKEKTKTKRAKQYKRAKEKPNVVITSRDLDIFQDLIRMRVLTLFQIQKLHFPSKNRAQERLRRLFDAHYIDVIPYPRRIEGGGRAPNLYVLDRRGADVLRRDRPDFKFKWHHSYKTLSDDFIRHSVPLNRFMTLMRVAAPRNGFEKVTDWYSESELRRKPDYVEIKLPNEKKKRTAIIPDGFIVLERAGNKYPFFVEWDGTTETGKVIQEKVKKYTAYYQGGLYTKRYTFKLFRVLFVCGSNARMETLKKWVETTDIREAKGAFFFACIDTLSEDNILKAPVWRRAEYKGKVALL